MISLNKAIENQEKRVAAWKMAYERSQATLKSSSTTEGITGNYKERVDKAKHDAEAYQGARDALSALQTEDGKRDTNSQINEDQDKKDEAAAKKAEDAAKRIKELREQYAAEAKALMEKLHEYNEAELNDTLSKDDKEVNSLKIKYDKEIAETEASLKKLSENKYSNPKDIAAAEEQIGQLKINKNKAVADAIAKQQQELTDKIKAFQQEQTANTGTELDKQLEKNKKFYDEQAKNLKSGDYMGAIQILAARVQSNSEAELDEKKRLEAEKKKIDEEYATFSDQKEDSEKAKIIKKYNDEIAALKTKYSKELQLTKEFQDADAAINKNKDAAIAKLDQDNLKKWKVFAIDSFEKIADAEFSIAEAKRHAQLDAQVSALEKQKDAELSNTNLTEGQKAAINEKYAKQEAALKLKAWEADKAAKLEQALINGALAITKTFAELGWPAGILGAAATVVETGVQVDMIESQKPPQFAKGGIISGPSHEAGGIPLIDGNTGKSVAEVEGDETVAVFSKEATANNRMLINELLYNSQYRNGAPVTVDSGLAIKAMNQYRTGGVIPGFNGSSLGNTAGTSRAAGHGTDRLDRIETALHQFITEQRKENGKPVILSRRVQEQEDARVAAIRDAANAK